MKKAIVLLLALTVLGGAVFAQDAEPAPGLTGYFYAGVNLFDQDNAQSLGPSWLGGGQYANLGVSYKAPTAGFSATVEFENNAVNSAFRDYTIWAKPFGDILKLSTGKLRIGDYRLTSYIDGSGFNTRNMNAEYGLAAQVYPIAGLSLGAFDFVPTTGIDFAIDNFNFGASYKIDGIAKFVVAAKRNPIVVNAGSAATTASWALYTATGKETSGTYTTTAGVAVPVAVAGDLTLGTAYLKQTAAKAAVVATKVLTDEYFVGVDILAVEGLTAKVGGTFDLTENAGGALNNKFTTIWLTAGYGLLDGALDLGLDAYYKMNSGSKIYGKVQVAYTLGAFTPSVYGSVTNIASYDANTTKADGTTALAAADTVIDGTDMAFGAQVAIDAGKATIYVGFDFSDTKTDSDEEVAGVAWGIPLAIEIAF